MGVKAVIQKKMYVLTNFVCLQIQVSKNIFVFKLKYFSIDAIVLFTLLVSLPGASVDILLAGAPFTLRHNLRLPSWGQDPGPLHALEESSDAAHQDQVQRGPRNGGVAGRYRQR